MQFSSAPLPHRLHACHQASCVWRPKYPWVGVCFPHHDVIATSYVIMGPSLCANFRPLIKRGEDTLTQQQTQSIATSHFKLHLTNLLLLPISTNTHTTCLELPTSVTVRSTSPRTRSPGPTPRSSRRRRRTASTRARTTLTRLRTPVCFSQPHMYFLFSICRVISHLFTRPFTNNRSQRTSDPSPTSSSARRSVRRRVRRSLSRTVSASKMPPFPHAHTATSPPREPRSTRS